MEGVSEGSKEVIDGRLETEGISLEGWEDMDGTLVFVGPTLGLEVIEGCKLLDGKLEILGCVDGLGLGSGLSVGGLEREGVRDIVGTRVIVLVGDIVSVGEIDGDLEGWGVSSNTFLIKRGGVRAGSLLLK